MLTGYAWQHPVRPAVQDSSLVNVCPEAQFILPSTELQQFEVLTHMSFSVSSSSSNIARVKGGSSGISDTSDRFNDLLDHDKRMKFEEDFKTARLEIAQHLRIAGGVDKIQDALVAYSGVLALVSLAFDTDSSARRAQGIFTQFCREHPGEDIISVLRIHSSLVINDDPLVDVLDEDDLDGDFEHLSFVMEGDIISTAAGWILLHYYNQRYEKALKAFLGKDYQWFRSVTDFLGIDAQSDSTPVQLSAPGKE